MPQPRVRIDDQFRDPNTPGAAGSRPEQQIGSMPDIMTEDTADIPLTDPTAVTVTKTYTVTAAGALINQATQLSVQVADDNATITSVTYTPAASQAVPAAGNSRAYTLTGTAEGTVASFTFQNTSAAYVSGTPVNWTIVKSFINETETLNFQSTVTGGTGAADPGGTLSITYTI